MKTAKNKVTFMRIVGIITSIAENRVDKIKDVLILYPEIKYEYIEKSMENHIVSQYLKFIGSLWLGFRIINNGADK